MRYKTIQFDIDFTSDSIYVISTSIQHIIFETVVLTISFRVSLFTTYFNVSSKPVFLQENPSYTEEPV